MNQNSKASNRYNQQSFFKPDNQMRYHYFLTLYN